MPVYSKLLSAVALVALVVSGGAVNMNLRSNVAHSAPFEVVGTMAGRTAPQPEERRPAPQPKERRAPKPDERRPKPKPDERRRLPAPKPDERRPAPKDTRVKAPVEDPRVKKTAGPTAAEIYQAKISCKKDCKNEFKTKKESCGKGGKGKDCRISNKANKQTCLDDCSKA